MTDKEMIDSLNKLQVGSKISIGLEDIFGTPREVEGCYMGNLEQHGYYSEGGGWGLYSIEKQMPELKEIKCYQFEFKEKGKRIIHIYKIGYRVKNIKVI